MKPYVSWCRADILKHLLDKRHVVRGLIVEGLNAMTTASAKAGVRRVTYRAVQDGVKNDDGYCVSSRSISLSRILTAVPLPLG